MLNQAKVGDIPSDWYLKTISEVSATPVSNGLYKDKEHYGRGIRMIHMTEVFANNIITNQKMPQVELTKKEEKKYSLINGDLVFARRSLKPEGAGDVCLIQSDEALTFESSIIRARLNKLTNSKFIYYYLKSVYGKAQMMTIVRHVAVSGITGGDLKKFQLPLPPFSEQTKIAQILSTWDKAIDTTEKLIENSKAQKKALMQQLLTGKKRFQEFKDEWEMKRLGDVAKINSGGTPRSSVAEYYNGDIPWVSIADMTKHGKYITTTKKNITTLGLDNSSARLYPKNTVLYAMYASIGECSVSSVELCSSQAILGIQPNSKVCYQFLYYYLSSLKDKIKLQGQQGTQANLNAGMVKSFRLCLPSIEEQKKIATTLASVDKEIETLKKKLGCQNQEKKALMQQLLTGKRRVKLDNNKPTNKMEATK